MRLWAVLLSSALSEDGTTATPWPSCVLKEKTLRSPNPIYVDVRGYINHPDSMRHRTVTYSSEDQVGMALKDEPHELGEVVAYAVAGGQADKAGVKKGWIIKEIDGRPFKPSERLKDIADDFDKARKKGATLTVKYDVRTFSDCFNGTCSRSDRFPSDSLEQCAEACNLAEECHWWTLTTQDSDSVCFLSGKSQGFVKAAGTSAGAKACVPQPFWGTTSSWPNCVIKRGHLFGGQAGPVFTDVRKLIAYPESKRHRVLTFDADKDIGLILREKPTSFGEVVEDVVEGSQASGVGVKKGWIILDVNGKPFTKEGGVEDVSGAMQKLRDANTGLVVKFDVRTSIDCTNGDCSRSDKVPADSEADCAAACSQVAECMWWSFGDEDGDTMCWFRASGKGLKADERSSAGDRACSPPTGGWHFRWWFAAVIVAAAVKWREEITRSMPGRKVVQPVIFSLSRLIPGSGGATQIFAKGKGHNRGAALELGSSTQEYVLGDDDDDHEAYSLIGRRRKEASTIPDYDPDL